MEKRPQYQMRIKKWEKAYKECKRDRDMYIRLLTHLKRQLMDVFPDKVDEHSCMGAVVDTAVICAGELAAFYDAKAEEEADATKAKRKTAKRQSDNGGESAVE